MCFRVTDKEFQAVEDIHRHFIREDDLGKVAAQMNNRMPICVAIAQRPNDQPSQSFIFADTRAYTAAKHTLGSQGQLSYSATTAFFGYSGITQFGDCGSVATILVPSVQHKLCSIHSRGRDNLSIGAPVTYEYLEWIMQEDNVQSHGMNEEPEIVPNPYLERGVQYQDAHGLQVIGRPFVKQYVPTSTQECKTGIHLDKTHEPTIKSISDPRNILRIDFLETGIARYNDKVPKEPGLQEEVNSAAREIGEFYAAKIGAKGMTTRLLNNTEAINGTSRTEYPATGPLKREGAVGFPYGSLFQGKQKGDYLEQNARNLHWYFRKDPASQKILSDASRLFDDARRGREHEILWTAFLKDEPVKKSKIYNLGKQKTRLFFSGPMSYLLAYRRAFSAAIWRITELHLETPVRVGLASNTLEWHMLVTQHAQIAPNAFDSDMENWDGTVPIEYLRALPIIFNIIYKHTDAEHTPQHDTIRNTLHKAVEGARIIVRDRVVKLEQAMASGYPGTAVENSLINFMLYYCCWRRIMTNTGNTQFAHFEAFMANTMLSVFGDDNVCSVRAEFQHVFNFNSFKAEARKFGFKVTDAAKTGRAVPDFLPLCEIQFLKRKFNLQGHMYWPSIDPESISKQCEWIKGKGTYEYNGRWRHNNRPEVFAQCFKANLIEVAYHGEETYNDFVKRIRPQIYALGLEIVIPNWNDVIRETDFNVRY
jgi:hypothetical protein